VRFWQYLLRARGARIVADAIFGPRPLAAVVAFQRARPLVGDGHGVVGPRTWTSLIIVLVPGSHGDAVRAVQDQANFRNLKNG